MSDSSNQNRAFLSACVIARNEEDYLPRCLLSLEAAADEVVLIDTGSSDRTLEIAHGLGARVFRQEWNGDYSRSRNLALDFARGDWVLVLDADEELVREDVRSLRDLLREDKDAYLLTLLQISKDGYGQEGAKAAHGLRLFRNADSRRYRGRVSEELPYEDMRVGFSSVRIINHRKSARSMPASRKLGRIRRLEQWVAESPRDSLGHYYLGNEYVSSDEWEAAVEHLRTAWELLGEGQSGHGPHLLRNLAIGLRNQARHEEALEYLRQGAVAYRGYPDLEYLEAVIRLDREEYLLARECFSACLENKDPKRDYDSWAGIGGYLSWRGVGVCNRALGEEDEAVRAFESALRGHPQDSYSLLQLGEILLERMPPESARRRLESISDRAAPGIQAALHKLFG